jgi:hypothetical protein
MDLIGEVVLSLIPHTGFILEQLEKMFMSVDHGSQVLTAPNPFYTLCSPCLNRWSVKVVLRALALPPPPI